MSLEAGDGFVSGLVVTNPVNATDQVAQGDDHIRLIKTALKGTFPNLTGAVTATQAELNALDGITASVAELNIMDGVTLTAAQINDAARLSVVNTFTESQTISGTPNPYLRLRETAGPTDHYLQWTGDIFEMLAAAGDSVRLRSDGGTYAAKLDASGVLTTSGGVTVTTEGASAAEIGTAGAPARNVSASGNTTATDRAIRLTGGSGQTFTLDGDPPTDAVVVIDNSSGAAWTLAASGTLIWAVTAATGNRTMADDSLVVAFHRGSGVWIVNGGGLA